MSESLGWLAVLRLLSSSATISRVLLGLHDEGKPFVGDRPVEVVRLRRGDLSADLFVSLLYLEVGLPPSERRDDALGRPSLPRVNHTETCHQFVLLASLVVRALLPLLPQFLSDAVIKVWCLDGHSGFLLLEQQLLCQLHGRRVEYLLVRLDHALIVLLFVHNILLGFLDPAFSITKRRAYSLACFSNSSTFSIVSGTAWASVGRILRAI